MKRILFTLIMAIFAWNCSKSGKDDGGDCITGVCSETRVIGTILDGDGKPVQGAEVAIYRKTSTVAKAKKAVSSAAAADSLAGKVTTKADGKFEFNGVPQGEYVLNSVKDTLGVTKAFALAKDEKKDLGNLTLVNNGIIIGRMEGGIVQQAENAYAVINEIGQQTNISKSGDYTFNNVPVTTTNVSYTITIYNGDKTVLASKLDDILILVESNKATQIDTAGKITVTTKPATTKIVSPDLAGAAANLPNGKFVATIFGAAKDTLYKNEFTSESGRDSALSVTLASLPSTGKVTVQLQGIDSTGFVIYESKQTIDLGKDKLDSLNIPLTYRKTSVILKETTSQTVYAAIANIRRISILDSARKTVFKSSILRSTSTANIKIDSIPVGKGLILQSEWLSADSTAYYGGTDTLDILGAGKDTAFVTLLRKTGTVKISATFLNSDSSELSDIIFDTAWVKITGSYTDSLKGSFKPGSDGKKDFSVLVPADLKLAIGIFATSESGKRKFLGTDSVLVKANDSVTVSIKGLSGADSKTPGFAVTDTTIEIGDTATANLNWRNSKPETAALTLRSLNTTVLSIIGSKYFGRLAGTANVVATVAGITQPDTFTVTVKEKEFSVADMNMEVDDTAKAVVAWKTKAPATLTITYRSLNATLASVVSTSGLVTAKAAGTANIIATVTGVTKPDTFAVVITEPLRSYTLKLDTNSFEVVQGGDGRTKARLVRTKVSAAITFSVPALPEGVTVTFAPATTTADTSVMSIAVSTNTVPGNYRFGVIARTAGYTDRVDSVSLKVNRDNSMEWVKISTGYDHTCAINKSDDAYCWGTNTYGQLGIGTAVAQTRPTLVSGSLKWASINSGNSVSCGITKTGVGYCWGYGAVGMLGNGGTTNALVPTAISVTGGDLWSQLSVGNVATCGVTTDGRGYCWGINSYGQIGDSTNTTKVTRSQVKGSLVWKKIETEGFTNTFNHETSCGITVDNNIYCWGSNFYGELGDGNPGSGINPIPVKLLVSKPWSDIEMGATFACALTEAGEAYCWGANFNGALGIGSTINQSTPTLVLNDIKWTHLFGGYWANCGLDTQGKAYCWGINNYGQVGNGATSTAQTAPALVSGNQVWIDLGSGSARSCGINQFNQAYCWGNNNLGAGNTTSSLKPWRVSEPLAQ